MLRPLLVGPVVSIALAGLLVTPPAPASDGRPTLRLAVDGRVGEGAAAVVTVALDAPSGRDVTVRVDTRAGSALAPADYRGVHRRVTVPAGATAVTLFVSTVRDAVEELSEDFVVRLSRPVGADLGEHRATITIRDRPPLPRVRVEDASLDEPVLGHGLGFTVVVLSAPSRRRVVVELASRSGTAEAGQDFVPLHPTVVFEPGDTSQPVSVELLADDRLEPPETLRLAVTGVRHATAARGATITILDAPGGRRAIVDAWTRGQAPRAAR